MFKQRTTLLIASLAAVPLIGLGIGGSSMANASAPTAARMSVTSAAPATPVHRSAFLVPTGGVTMLKLDTATAKVLTANGVTVAPASEARPGPSGISFPIQGGLLRAANLRGRITHAGGLTFTAGGKSLTVRDFYVSTVTGRLSGYADEAGARITILDLSLAHAKVRSTKTTLAVSNITATLDKQAAKALNGYFSTTLFSSGLKIGTARVSADTVLVLK